MFVWLIEIFSSWKWNSYQHTGPKILPFTALMSQTGSTINTETKPHRLGTGGHDRQGTPNTETRQERTLRNSTITKNWRLMKITAGLEITMKLRIREHFKINSPETRNSGSHISTLTLTVAHLSSVSLATPTWYLPHLFKDLPDKVEQTRRSSKVRHHTAIQGRSGTTEKQSSWDLSVWKRLQSHF